MQYYINSGANFLVILNSKVFLRLTNPKTFIKYHFCRASYRLVLIQKHLFYRIAGVSYIFNSQKHCLNGHIYYFK
jgi:hypothetical protein